MVFGFIRDLWSPDAGRRALRASYVKHYNLAKKRNMEPIAIALLGALASRYKLRGRFVSEFVHMTEIAPFAMMREEDGREAMIDYVLAGELPDQIDATLLASQINAAFRDRPGANADAAYELVLAGLPHLKGSGIRWFAMLDDENRERLRQDALKTYKE